jgi:hypothetical protein
VVAQKNVRSLAKVLKSDLSGEIICGSVVFKSDADFLGFYVVPAQLTD